MAYIEIPLRDPLSRNWDEGEIMKIWQSEDKGFNFQLIENALKGERRIKAIPLDEVLN